MEQLADLEMTIVPVRVLVVDDNPGDARLIAILLEGGIYSCATVSTYEEGLEAIREQAHDAYLIDYKLGNRTGLDLIEEASGSSSGPLILLTGLDDEALDGLALRAGAADYLTKNTLTSENVTRSIRYAVETWKSQRLSDLEKERYRALYEGVPMGIGRVSPDGFFTEANQFLVNLFRFPDLASLIGLPLADFFERPDGIEDVLARSADGDDPVPFELQMKRYDDTYLWVGGVAQALRRPDGEVFAFEGVVGDISARKEAEAQVKLQSTILDQVRSAVMVTDMSGRVTYWNQHAEELTGWKAQETLGRPWQEVTVPPHMAHYTAEIVRRIHETGHWSGEYDVLRKDGSTFPTYVVDTVISDDSGAPVAIVGIATDLTERVESERALRESQQLFKEIFDGSPVPMSLFQVPGGRLISVNRAMADFFGYSIEQLVGMTRQDLTHPDEVAADMALFDRLVAGELLTYEIEKHYARADGTVMWGMLRISVIGDLQDHSGLGLAHIVDVTARKAAEAEIMFQTSLLDQVHNAVIATDLAGTVTYWNKYAEQLYGWSALEIMGRNLAEATVPLTEPAELGAEIAAALFTEGKWEGEVVLYRKDGSSFHAWSSDALLRDHDGRPIGVVGIKVDLTQQKESQAEAQRQGDLARSVLEALQYPQAVISFEGQILAANNAWTRLIEDAGLVLENAGIGADYVAVCRRALAPEGFDRNVVAGIEAVLGGTAERYRHDYSLTAGTSEKWFRMDVTPVAGTGAVVAHWDVTDERKARTALEDLIRAKDEFIASVSHELRTPLTAVVGLTQELSEGRIEPHEVPELQTLIAQQAQEVSDIVEDLLVAARASADTITIRPNPFNIRREIEVVVKPWLRGGANAIDLTAVDSKLVGRGDAVRVRQIMRNLVANAVRYGGRPIAVEARSDGRAVKIAVRDHGDGIPSEAVDRMFEPYARLGGQAGLPSSVGLGLYVSRLLARMMDGDLQYQRRDGVTEFCLTLPVERREPEIAGVPPGGVKDRCPVFPPQHS
ncbi:MAG TPA: PAS domain S-box protein [Acidimicrobiia bacterium]|nr:PAS domain S-box protein [Acidimicrobiia bacterium]